MIRPDTRLYIVDGAAHEDRCTGLRFVRLEYIDIA